MSGTAGTDAPGCPMLRWFSKRNPRPQEEPADEWAFLRSRPDYDAAEMATVRSPSRPVEAAVVPPPAVAVPQPAVRPAPPAPEDDLTWEEIVLQDTLRQVLGLPAPQDDPELEGLDELLAPRPRAAEGDLLDLALERLERLQAQESRPE